jgi:hypothetical protein
MPALHRHAGALLGPVALLALACGVTVAAQRRRTAVEVVIPLGLPAPSMLPSVERFEWLVTGESALLRVHTVDAVEPKTAVLVVDRGNEMDLVTPITTPMSGGALGFACSRGVLEGATSFWLQLDGATASLPAPAIRSLQ